MEDVTNFDKIRADVVKFASLEATDEQVVGFILSSF